MTPAQPPAPPGAGVRSRRYRAWAIRAEPRPLAVYVTAVVVVACAGAVVYAMRTPLRPYDLAIFGVLALCGSVCVEGTRRLGEPQLVARDLVFAWGLPVALLLPPLYAFLFPIPVAIVTQLRVKRSPLHRRVFSTAVRGIACAAASIVFHLGVSQVSGAAEAAWFADTGRVLPIALGTAFLCIGLNEVLVAVVVRLSATDASWREVIWEPEAIKIDLVELCVGLLVVVAAALSLPLVVLALPPVLLLQRSLVHAQLRAAARTDAKTGLLNVGTWRFEAEREVARVARTKSPVAVLLVDIDHFKHVNDEYGHLLGDDILVKVAELLGSQLRGYDLVGRFGGEEFVVLLPEADAVEARRVAERLRSHATAIAIPVDDHDVTVTVSIGVALLRAHGEDLDELIAAADVALYHAKATGRNRVCLPAGDGVVEEGDGWIAEPHSRMEQSAVEEADGAEASSSPAETQFLVERPESGAFRGSEKSVRSTSGKVDFEAPEEDETGTPAHERE